MSRPPQLEATWKTRSEEHYRAFVDRLSARARETIEKHAASDEIERPAHDPKLWKRFAGGLSRLAPHAAELEGRHSAKFYIRDGKYRQQVFALQTSAEGHIIIFLPDILALAISKKILAKGDVANNLKVVGNAHQHITLDIITADTPELTLAKAMVSWGKKALRTQISIAAPEESLRTVERLCELAAEAWAGLDQTSLVEKARISRNP